MTRTSRYLIAAAIALPLICSCDDRNGNEGTVEGTMPQTQEFTLSAGDSQVISFNAPDKWTAVSDKIWCQIETVAGLMQNAYGEAGEANITVVIGDTGIDFENSETATITLSAGERTAALATVTRLPEEYRISVTDAEGNVLEALEAGCGSYVDFVVSANFPLSAELTGEYAENLELRDGGLYAAPGADATGGLKIRQDAPFRKYPTDLGKALRFVDGAGNVHLEMPVHYAGMEPDAIEFNLPGPSVYGWALNVKGNNLSLGERSYGLKYSFEVTCLNDEFSVVRNFADAAEPWANVTVDGVAVTVTFSENEGDRARQMDLYVLPKAVYDRMGGSEETVLASAAAAEDPAMMARLYTVLSVSQDFFDVNAEDGQVTPQVLRWDFGMGSAANGWEPEYPLLEISRIRDRELMTRFGVKAAYEMTYSMNCIIVPNIEGLNTDSYGRGMGEVDIRDIVKDILKAGYQGDWSELSEAEIEAMIDLQIEAGLGGLGLDDLATGRFWHGDTEIEPELFELYDGLSNGMNLPFGVYVKGVSFMFGGPGDIEWTEPVYAVFSVNGIGEKLIIINPPAADRK